MFARTAFAFLLGVYIGQEYNLPKVSNETKKYYQIVREFLQSNKK
jgi:hypothetical protein